jgi:chemotaxis protein MotA
MNIYSIVGLIIAVVVLFFGLKLSSDDFYIFVDYPSLFIVFGGTAATMAISFQINRLGVLVKIFLRRLIKGKRFVYADTIKLVMTYGDEYRKGASIKSIIDKVDDMFFKEALTLVEDGILSKEEAMVLMDERNENIMMNHMTEANRFKTLAKFPPAWGAIGTTIGMIVLLSNLGGEDAIKMIGPAMSIALITTLYGGVASNALLLPIAENLVDSAKEIYLKNKIILEGVKLLLQKQNPIIVAEKLNSFLPPAERLDWKKVLAK